MSFQNCKIIGAGVDPQEYHGQTAERGSPDFIISPSSLKAFSECPEEWVEQGRVLRKLNGDLEKAPDRKERERIRRRIGEIDRDSAAFSWGSLIDSMVLTPEHFGKHYRIRPETYEEEVLECPKCGSVTESKSCRKCKVDRVMTKREVPWNGRAEACQDWVDEQELAGRTIIPQTQMDLAAEAVVRLKSKPAIKKVIDCSDKQVHVRGEWHDQTTGIVIPVQCLIDLVPRLDTDYVPGVEMMWGKCLGDLKTCASADIAGFARKVDQFGWDVQAYFDCALYCAATGEDRNTWLFIGQKNYGVFQPFKRILTQDFMDHGKAKCDRMLSNYAVCLKRNIWPDYDATDEAIYGFGQCAPEPWMAMREQFSPKFNLEAEEQEPTSPELTTEDIPT